MSRFEQLTKIIREANDGLATYSDIKKLFDALVTFVRNAKTEISEKVDKNKDEIELGIQEIKKIADISKKDLSTRFAKLESDLRSDIRTTIRMFEQNVKDLKDEIPEEYEDSELRYELSRIEKLIPTTPEGYDDSSIKNEIEELEDDVENLKTMLEELKSRPAGNGGGVTNARITQAFKYILKTEQPTGDIDGVNLTYRVSQPIFAILSMSLNGETIAQLPNYTIAGNTFTFSSALPSVYNGKDWEVKYI